MRKRGDQDISSLDMLLDTMCNTFGGIVFIALLIAVLSSSLSNKDEDAAQEKNETIAAVDSDIETSRLLREQKEIQAALRHLEATLVKTGQEHGNSGSELAALVASNEMLRIEISSLEETNTVLATAIADSEKTTERNTMTESDLRVQISTLNEELREQSQKSIRSVRLPRIHAIVGKRPVFVIIKDQKLYMASALRQQTRTAEYPEFDVEDVAVEQGPGMYIIEAKKNAGQLVVANCEQQGKISQILSRVEPANAFVDFYVDANSFAAFNYVKAVFVSRGFEYNWTVLAGALQIVELSNPQFNAQ
jgi:regulator of replication initiation timing